MISSDTFIFIETNNKFEEDEINSFYFYNFGSTVVIFLSAFITYYFGLLVIILILKN